MNVFFCSDLLWLIWSSPPMSWLLLSWFVFSPFLSFIRGSNPNLLREDVKQLASYKRKTQQITYIHTPLYKDNKINSVICNNVSCSVQVHPSSLASPPALTFPTHQTSSVPNPLLPLTVCSCQKGHFGPHRWKLQLCNPEHWNQGQRRSQVADQERRWRVRGVPGRQEREWQAAGVIVCVFMKYAGVPARKSWACSLPPVCWLRLDVIRLCLAFFFFIISSIGSQYTVIIEKTLSIRKWQKHKHSLKETEKSSSNWKKNYFHWVSI